MLEVDIHMFCLTSYSFQRTQLPIKKPNMMENSQSDNSSDDSSTCCGLDGGSSVTISRISESDAARPKSVESSSYSNSEEPLRTPATTVKKKV